MTGPVCPAFPAGAVCCPWLPDRVFPSPCDGVMFFSVEPLVLLLTPVLLFLGMVSIVCFRVLIVFTREVVAAGPFQRDVFLVRKLPFLPDTGVVGMFTRFTE